MISIEDLVGQHILRGVDVDRDPDKHAGFIRFQFGDRVYIATEDPDDGWRSRMEGVVECDDAIINRISDTPVLARMQDSVHNNVLEVLHAETGNLIMAFGTHDQYDYYPSWVAEFNPEAL